MTTQRLSGRLMLSGVLGLAVAAVGCQQQTYEPATPQAQAPMRTTPRGTYRPNVGAGWSVNQLAFPTGDVSSSALLLSTVTPAEVRSGQPYTYQLHVTNLSDAPLQGVNVMASNAQNLEVTGSKPEASKSGNGYSWAIGNLAPNETRIIEVTGRADQVGTSANCLSASYNNLLCTMVKVVQPSLQLVKSAPAEVSICEPIPYVFEVRNTGSGTAQAVHLRDTLPSGLTTTDGQQAVDATVGDLAAGESKRVTVQVRAARPGSYRNTGTAVAGGNLTVNSNETTTVVRQPVLTVTAQSPERIFMGRNVPYTFVVKNTGDGVSRNTVLTVATPAGATLAPADGGTATGTGLSYNLGDLAPGATKTFTVNATPTGMTNVALTATAQGVCAQAVNASAATNVQGIPAILLEVVDLVDPVEVGGQTTYVIQATNQGSAPGTGIKIVATIGDEQDYVSSTGATTGTVAGKTITFGPLPTLAPKARAEWRVTVKANSAADVRFRLQMTSDQFTKPVDETESTNQYK